MDVEKLGTSAVVESISRTDYLDSYINDGDKEPSWDGKIYIYKEEELKKKGNPTLPKKNIIGKVHVQVKGVFTECFDKEEISYPAEISDLKNYLFVSHGAMYFVVYVSRKSNMKKIYYSALPPLKLRGILKEAESNISTKNITLTAFPTDNGEKYRMVLDCFRHCERQASFASVKLSTIEELSNTGVLEGISSFTVSSKEDAHDPIKAFLKNETYLYANVKGTQIPIPLESIPSQTYFSHECPLKITVNDRLFYRSCIIIRSQKTTSYKIGESFLYTHFLENDKVEMKYTDSDSLRNFIIDVPFILAVFEAGYFELNGNKISVNFNDTDKTAFIEEHQKLLENWKKAKKMFTLLGVTEDINISKLNSKDFQNIHSLVKVFVDHENKVCFEKDIAYKLELVKIEKHKFLLEYILYDEDKKIYEINDFFNSKHPFYGTYSTDNKEYECSRYMLLKADDLIEITNVKFDVLLPSFKAIEENSNIHSDALFFMLELLLAYDKCIDKKRKNVLIKTADDFSLWIEREENGTSDIGLINRLQVLKRQRELTKKENQSLYRLIERKPETNLTVAAHLLLGNQDIAEFYFEELNNEAQEDFKRYPIYYFWKS